MSEVHVELDDGAVFRGLSEKNRTEFVAYENEVKENFLRIVNGMLLGELKAFNKAKHRDLMITEMKQHLPNMNTLVINTACHYISNALQNESQSLIGQHRRGLRKDKVRAAETRSERPLQIPNDITDETGVSLSDSLDMLSLNDIVGADQIDTGHEQTTYEDRPLLNVSEIRTDDVSEETSAKTTENHETQDPIIDDEETSLKAVNGSKSQEPETKKKKTKSQKKKDNSSENRKHKDQQAELMCICQQPESGEMIQCNWCQEWYHILCMNIKKDDNVSFWICTECRTLPKVVKEIQGQLSSIMNCNKDLVRDVASKTVRIQQLQSENERLRKLLDRNQTESKTVDQQNTVSPTDDNLPESLNQETPVKVTEVFGTLLAGSSIIRDFNRNKFFMNFDPICVRGGNVSDIAQCLLQQPTTSKRKTIILHVGSNDSLDKDFDVQTFTEDYTALVGIASKMSESVVVSGLCPRLDDRHGNIEKANTCLAKIASDQNCLYVDNDPLFRLGNGAVDTSLYNRDGVHLNAKGVSKLASSLEIEEREKGGTSQNFGNSFQRGKKSPSGWSNGNQVNARPKQKRVNNSPVNHQRPSGNIQGNYRHSSGRSGNKPAGISLNPVHVNSPAPGNYVPKPREPFHNYVDFRSNDVVVCYFCGEDNHVSTNCKYGESLKCYECGFHGHKARMCNY